jgi:hypothetical protein
MTSRPLADILASIDPASIIVDSYGRITGADPETVAKLREFNELETLAADQPIEVNVTNCHCTPPPPPTRPTPPTPPIQSGCS